MFKKLINPFVYIAGSKSLVLGLGIIFLTSYTGYLSNTHFPDIISIKLCPELPFIYFAIQGLLNWLVPGILLYIASVIISNSSVRFIDILGTQALARFPYFIGAFTGFFDAYIKFSDYLLWSVLGVGEPVSITSFTIFIAILTMLISLLIIIWLITLMVNAYKVSANISGSKLVLSFITVILVSIAITMFTTRFLYLKFY